MFFNKNRNNKFSISIQIKTHTSFLMKDEKQDLNLKFRYFPSFKSSQLEKTKFKVLHIHALRKTQESCNHPTFQSRPVLTKLKYLRPLQTAKELSFLSSNNNKHLLKKENFWNLSFDKGRIKSLVSWFLKNYGQKRTIQLVESLKNIGFEYATKAGISLGIDDLKISPNKSILIAEAEKQTHEVITQYKRGEITNVERFQRLIDTWHRTSENLKQEVIHYFEVTDLFNPVYMMAFSGARGNISQVRQLVGMRGLMADPKGQILDFPIRSNFREGLTLTEYLISSYGARKGIVDTALRTANAGYLTRRLVDVAQHVIVSHYDCGTNRGIVISDIKESNKTIYSLQNRLLGRVLAQDILSDTGPIAFRNQEISSELAIKISKIVPKVKIRSPLTCETRKLICQLCYGWSLGQGKLVSIGDAVGVIAAQSIGEPGTQLTMRTFHTGGVFSSDVNDQILGPYDGIIEYASAIPGTLVRTPQGKIAFLTKAEGSFVIKNISHAERTDSDLKKLETKIKFFKVPSYTLLFCRHKEKIYFKQVVAQICSSSTQTKQRDDAEQSIQSEIQGQIYMDRLTLIEQTTNYGDITQQTWDWGYIWILSGKIYEIPVDSSVFPKFGDFVNKDSILNQIQWKIPERSILNLQFKSEPLNKDTTNLLSVYRGSKFAFPSPDLNTNVFNYLNTSYLKRAKYEPGGGKKLGLLALSKKVNRESFQFLDCDLQNEKALQPKNFINRFFTENPGIVTNFSIPQLDITKSKVQLLANKFNYFSIKHKNIYLNRAEVEYLSSPPKTKAPSAPFLHLKGRSMSLAFEQNSNIVTPLQEDIMLHPMKESLVKKQKGGLGDLLGSAKSVSVTKTILDKNLFQLSELLKNGNQKANTFSLDLKLKKPLLALETNKFVYNKIGYFFNIHLPILMSNLSFNNELKKGLNFVNPNDKFFLPVGLDKSNKILNSKIRFQNSFDWKIEPYTFLTWFPSLFSTSSPGLISYQIPNQLIFNNSYLSDGYNLIFQQKNSIFYSRILKNNSKSELKNLNSNQKIHSKKINLIFYKEGLYLSFTNQVPSKTKNQFSNKNFDGVPFEQQSSIINNFSMDDIRYRFEQNSNIVTPLQQDIFISQSPTSFDTVLSFSTKKINNKIVKKFWFFSQKQQKFLLKTRLPYDLNTNVFNYLNTSYLKKTKHESLSTINLFKSSFFEQNSNIVTPLQPANLNKYSELRWKNSKTYCDKNMFYRGRILWVSEKINNFIVLNIRNKKIQFKTPILDWKFKNSLLYYDLTKQGKKIPFFNNGDGLIQIYNQRFKNANTFCNGVTIFEFCSKTNLNKTVFVNGRSMSLFNKTNKKYYSALKFKLHKIKSYYSTTNVALLPTNYKLVNNAMRNDLNTNVFNYLNTSYLNKNQFLSKNLTLNKNFLCVQDYSDKLTSDVFQNNNLFPRNYYLNKIKLENTSINYLKLKKTNNLSSLSSHFNLSSFHLTNSLHNHFIFNKVNSRIVNINVHLKSGWVYIPNNLSLNLIKYQKLIVPLGKILCDDVIFDRQLVSIECIPVTDKFLKHSFSFLNNFEHSNSSDFDSANSKLYNFIRQRHCNRKKGLLKRKDFLRSGEIQTFSVKNLNWVCSSKQKNFSSSENLNTNVFNYLNTSYLKTKHESSDLNTNVFNYLNTSYLKGSRFEPYSDVKKHKVDYRLEGSQAYNLNMKKFIVLIKKVQELNLDKFSNYKRKLYNSTNKNWKSEFSFLLTQNYHTVSLNKQSKSLKLISKFPNLDIQIEPVFKRFNANKFKIMNKKSGSLTDKAKHEPLKDQTNIIFTKKPLSLVYFKLHFTNNSTFQMFFKNPTFQFNNFSILNFNILIYSYYVFSKASLNYPQKLNLCFSNSKKKFALLSIDILNNFFNLKNTLFDKAQTSPFFDGIRKLSVFPSQGEGTNPNYLKNLSYGNHKKNKLYNFLFILTFSSYLSRLIGSTSFSFSLMENTSYFLNDRFLAKTKLNSIFASSKLDNTGLSISSKNFNNINLVSNSFPALNNSYILRPDNKIFSGESFVYSSFLSPYEGEVLLKNKVLWNTTFQKNRLLILTKEDLISFRVKNLTSFFEKKNNIKPNIPQLINRSISSNMLDLNQEISTHNNICVQFANQVYKVDNLVLEEPMAKNIFLVGEFIFYGDKITETIGVPQGGQVVHLNSKKLTIRRGQSIFLSSKAILHAYNGDLIDKNYPVVTLPYQKLKAGDIVQGIPKIEQFFEARITRRGRLFRDSIPNLLRGLFKRYKSKYSIGRAVRQSLYKIQQILVDGVQRVYRSQGVTIADKHIEIIVKQMTSKVKIINGGQTGFFPGELVDLEFVEQINNILMKKIYYEPLVLGITKASLEVDSFLSAASFQQTTRVLSKAAISKKKDFLKGLKENVIVGNLIPAGTGYLIYLQDLEKLRFKNIFLRKSNV